ncbi:uncharacterized protein LOC133682166 [Populus nigra]|uniref:uncharacterized protein LOC133682166 n=1 Tax=Populus nigra TaxID=3691 RepID=UPI002B276BB1|nr:uncharacterized protein LOC133682166 [Populus nigra]
MPKATSVKGDSTEKLKGIQIRSLDDDDEVEEVVEEEEDDSEEEEPVTLGFLEKPKDRRSLLRQVFPSKAGGAPAWLDPVNLPSGRSCVCDICEEPIQFLLQVFLLQVLCYGQGNSHRKFWASFQQRIAKAPENIL